MTNENSGAGAPEFAGSAGPKGERLEGLTNTKPKPDPAVAISILAELFPTTFVAERWQPHRPLKVGTHVELVITGILTPAEVAIAKRHYSARRMYHAAPAAGGPRYELDGNVAGEVTPEQIADARAKLAAMDAKAMKEVAETLVALKAARTKREAERAKDAAQFVANRRAAQKPVEGRNAGSPHHETRPEIVPAQPPQPAESTSPQPRRLGLADLKRAFQERKAMGAAR